MTLTEDQRKEFEKTVRPLIKWLNDNMHPHATVIVDSMRAELVEVVCAFVTEEYLVD